jgi:hypothetical protein
MMITLFRLLLSASVTLRANKVVAAISPLIWLRRTISVLLICAKSI